MRWCTIIPLGPWQICRVPAHSEASRDFGILLANYEGTRPAAVLQRNQNKVNFWKKQFLVILTVYMILNDKWYGFSLFLFVGIENVAEAGDTVSVHFRLRTSEGEVSKKHMVHHFLFGITNGFGQCVREWLWLFRSSFSDFQLLESSEQREPLMFELGAGQVMGNPLFQVTFVTHWTLRSQFRFLKSYPSLCRASTWLQWEWLWERLAPSK